MSTVQLSTNLSGGLYNYYIGPCPGPLTPYVGNPTSENPITVNLLNYGWTSGDYCYKICGAIPPSFTDGCCCSDTGTGECCDKWSLYTTQTGGCTYTVLDCDNNLYELLVAPFNNEIICAKNVTYTCNNSNADVVEECDCSIVTTRYSVVDCCNDPSNTIIIKVTDSDQLPSLPFTINNYFIDGNINNRRCLKFVEEISGEVTPDFTYTATEVLSAIVENEGCPPSGSTTTVTIPQGGTVTICSVTDILNYTEGFVEITTEEACDGISAEFCTSYTLQGLPGQTITYAPCVGVESTCTDCNNNLYYSAQNCCGGDTVYFEIIQDIDFTLPDTPYVYAIPDEASPWNNDYSNCWTIMSQVQEPPIGETTIPVPLSVFSNSVAPESVECSDTITTNITNLASDIDGAQVIDVIDGVDIYNFTICTITGSLTTNGSFGSQIDVENSVAVIVSEQACGGTTSEFCTSYNINANDAQAFTYLPCYYGSDSVCQGCLPSEGSFHIFCNCEEPTDTPIPYQYDVSEPYSPYPICSGMTFTNNHPTETITIATIGAQYSNCPTSSLYDPGYLTIQPGQIVTECSPYDTYFVINSTPNGTGTIGDISIVNNGDGGCDNQYYNVPLEVYDVCDLLPLMTSGLTESGDVKYSAPETAILDTLTSFYFGYDATLIPWLDQNNNGTITTSDLLIVLADYTSNGEIILPQECYQLSCNYVIDDGNEYQEGQYYSIYGVDYNDGLAIGNPETNCYRYDGMYNGTVDINDILIPQGTNAINQTPFTSCSECTGSTLSVTIGGYTVTEGNPGSTNRIQFSPNGSISGSDLNVTLANWIRVGTQDGEWTNVFQSVTSGTQFTVQSVPNPTENVVITVDVGYSVSAGDSWKFPILSLDSYTQDEPFSQGESVTLTIS